MAARTRRIERQPGPAGVAPPPEEAPPRLDEAEDAPDEADGGEVGDQELPPRQPRRRTSKARASGGRAAPKRRRSIRGAFRSEDGRQLKLPFVRPEVMKGRAVKVGGGIILFVVLIIGVFVAYHLFAGSRFFALNGVDVEGNKLMAEAEVEGLVRTAVPAGVLNADLAQIRAKLEGFPLIRQAKVVRLLPDRLRVTILERVPVAVARFADGRTACVDDEGAFFGTRDTWRGKDAPLISGLVEGQSENNRQLVLIYKRLLEELDQNEPPLSSRLDEVSFDPDRGISVSLANTGIMVLLGRNDFRARLNTALDVIEVVNRRDADRLGLMKIGDADRLLSGVPIKYLNVTDPSRVVVGLDE
jgi:cell division protein FtsQ